jgi:YVTN family beta-propeller protein
MKTIPCACVAAALLAGTPAFARETLYVQAGDDIQVLDAETYKPIATIPIGDHTDDVIGSPDGRIAYGNAAISTGNPVGGADSGKVFAIDTATNKIIWSRSLDGHPQHLTVSKDGRRLFAPAINSNYISVLDTANGRVVDRWFSNIGNHGTELSPDGKRLYVGNMFRSSLDVYDTDTGEMVRSYAAHRPVRPFKMDAAEAKVYYQLSYLHGFEVRDIASGKLLDRVEFSRPESELENATYSHGMAITPDGKRLVAVGTLGKFARIYSLPGLKLLGSVPVGDDANWVRIRADSKVAFVSNRGSGTMSAIDVDTVKEIARFPAGSHPGRFAIVDVPEGAASASR